MSAAGRSAACCAPAGSVSPRLAGRGMVASARAHVRATSAVRLAPPRSGADTQPPCAMRDAPSPILHGAHSAFLRARPAGRRPALQRDATAYLWAAHRTQAICVRCQTWTHRCIPRCATARAPRVTPLSAWRLRTAGRGGDRLARTRAQPACLQLLSHAGSSALVCIPLLSATCHGSDTAICTFAQCSAVSSDSSATS